MKKENREYLNNKPEIDRMLTIYMIKLLEERPQDVITFTGNFFNRNNLESHLKILEEHYYKNQGKNHNKEN